MITIKLSLVYSGPQSLCYVLSTPLNRLFLEEAGHSKNIVASTGYDTAVKRNIQYNPSGLQPYPQNSQSVASRLYKVLLIELQ